MIDAHVHIWRIGANGCTWPTPELAPIHRDFGLDDYRAQAGTNGIDGVILVQSQEDDADTRWLLDTADDDPFVRGVIGWCNLADAGQIDRLAYRAKLRGVRPMVQDRPADWFDDRTFDEALAALAAHGSVLDALVRPNHLPSLERLAKRHPDLTIVIDHAAKPDLTDIGEWRDEIERIAAQPNVACKLSGLLTELADGAAPEDIASAAAVILAAFGPDRIIWGSDWPVLRLASTFRDWLAQARALVPPSDHVTVFGGNAARLYGIAA